MKPTQYSKGDGQSSKQSEAQGTQPTADALDKPRAKIMWAVDYTEEQECELGYTHKVDNVLAGLKSKEDAEREAKILKGKITRHYHTPKLSDDEIKLLNDLGVPAERSIYGLTFKDL